MHDIRFIRDNPDAFDKALARRGLEPQAQRLIALDEQRRAKILALETAQARRNAASKEIGEAKKNKDEEKAKGLLSEVAVLKESMPAMEAEEKKDSKALDEALAEIPNLPLDDVPDGKDEKDNVEHHRFGAKREYAIIRKGNRITPKGRELIIHAAQSDKTSNAAVARKFGISTSIVRRLLQQSRSRVPKPHLEPADTFAPKQHFDLGEALGQMDFETAAKLSGARFVVLKKGLARLERALGQFMLDMHTSDPHNYTEVAPPLLVRDDVMFGTAQLPKFQYDQFVASRISVRDDLLSEALKDIDVEYEKRDRRGSVKELLVELLESAPTKEDFWLIPTAEVPLTNLVRESIVDEAQLPMRFTACTPCFRAEAGAAGKDTRGMIRQHQFTKVELVSITTPEQSKDEHERMLACAEEVLKKLDLHYRVMILCAGDMGFASQKTYDIEVWLPGQNVYREISSISICGEFQARRMNARYRPRRLLSGGALPGAAMPGRGTPNQPPTQAPLQHVHTLNGSGVAVGRALIAVMETYQQADGSIAVPEALQSYMGGMKKIEK
jgi:seryl-tRNA synthetase